MLIMDLWYIAFFPSKEWKPKTSQKPVPSPGVIGSPVKSASKTADDAKNSDEQLDVLENKLLQVTIHESQNVIIAQHIRIPENDRCTLTFGSFGIESDGTENLASASQATESAEEAAPEPSPRFVHILHMTHALLVCWLTSKRIKPGTTLFGAISRLS